MPCFITFEEVKQPLSDRRRLQHLLSVVSQVMSTLSMSFGSIVGMLPTGAPAARVRGQTETPGGPGAAGISCILMAARCLLALGVLDVDARAGLVSAAGDRDK